MLADEQWKRGESAKDEDFPHATEAILNLCVCVCVSVLRSTDIQEFWPWLILRQRDEVQLPAEILRIRSWGQRLP